jgi:lysophospholipase L1-like esterase
MSLADTGYRVAEATVPSSDAGAAFQRAAGTGGDAVDADTTPRWPWLKCYRAKPNQDITRFGHRIRFNSQGLRNDDISAVPAAGVVRVLCLGDSITSGGVAVSNDRTYPGQLQALLQAHNDKHKVEVLNASEGGWALANEMGWVLEMGLFGSQVVVLEIGVNDLFQAMAPSSTVGTNVSFPSDRPLLAWQELLHRYALPRLGLTSTADPGVNVGSDQQQQVAPNLLTIQQMVKAVRATGAKPVVLFIEPPRAARSADAGTADAEDRLFKLLASLQVPLVRPAAQLEAEGGQALFRDAIHPNDAGNRVIAMQLKTALSGVIQAP